MSDNKFLFSIIIPIYKVEKYLAETIDSVINQTIGFEDVTQIILVNDGSPDDCEKICLDYSERYPDNIKYVLQENAGVSAARNTGIPYAQGKYINFLDSDDKWAPNALENAYNFFEEHYDEIDVLAGRIKQFEASSRFHVLDYKFRQGTRVCDLTDESEYASVQLHVSSAFVKAEAIGEKRFNSDVKYGEDSLFINGIILEKMAVGVCKEALFLYRKRADQSSAIQTQLFNKEYYFKSPLNYYFPLMEISRKLHGEVVPYIQHLFAYDLGWRLGTEVPDGVLTEEEKNDYINMLRELYSHIDDSAIVSNRVHRTALRKMTAFYLKNNTDTFFKDMEFNAEEKSLYYNGTRMVTFDKKFTSCFVHIAKIENETLHLEGLVSKWILGATKLETEFVIDVGGKTYKPELSEYPFRKENTILGTKYAFSRFVLDIPLKDAFASSGRKLSITPKIVYGSESCGLAISYGKFIANYNNFLFSTINFKPYYIKCFRNHIRVTKPACYAASAVYNEGKRLAWLLLRKHRRAFVTRIIYFLTTLFLRGGKKIWLVSDRSDKANDNGEAFFKFVTKQNNKKIKPIFVINKNSEDAERIKKIGKVIHPTDFLYPYYFLSADKIVSSSGGEYTINAFDGVNRRYLADLMKFDYIFLQHGVIMNDLSAWLQKFNKNISMFITSTNKEYGSIVNTNYFYTPDEVKLTGLPRFDELEDRTEKLILILPTWRRSIKESYDSETKSVYFDGFRETEYFNFYNDLINNEKLLAVMRKSGYKGLFCLHPIHQKQHVDFERNDVFDISSDFLNYKDIFSRSALLVTDYSSVAFDFAYLRKPIIYAQFDKEEFFSGQIYDEGYFSYEKDGMGPVTPDLETTVDEMIRLIENNCAIDSEYKKKVDCLFAYNDKNNSRRIYEEILAMN